ncbi:MAG: Mth938-like domain-containing protein [Alphaproteobacteria bacterium]
MPADPTSDTIVHQIVERYGAGKFQISGLTYQNSVLVFPERTVDWSVSTFTDIDADALATVLAESEAASEIELLLLGCGPRMELVSQSLRAPLRAAGIVIEPMDTGAAARTFNLLLSEDRRVAAALIVLP